MSEIRNWGDVVALDGMGVNGLTLSEALMKYADLTEKHDYPTTVLNTEVCHCVYCQVLVPMARKLEAQPAAIPTRTRLPQVGDRVQVFAPNYNVKPMWEIGTLVSGTEVLRWEVEGEDYELQLSDVSHWLPLPPAPTSEEK